MTIRSRVKAELDKVEDEYLGVVQRVLASLARPSSDQEEAGESSREFLASTYGSMADAPIECGEEGELDAREKRR